jgi:uncharacterized DUF497 family protein
MKLIRWDAAKNAKLKKERGIGFEEVVACVDAGGLLAIIDHPNQARHPGQKVWVVAIRGYAHLVPMVVTEDEVVLKTIIPSRKATRDYLKRSGHED